MKTSDLPSDASIRLDKWLWAARFFKTRGLAAEAVEKGQVRVNGQTAKPARAIRPGDTLTLRRTAYEQCVTVRALSSIRGPAVIAQGLYEESAESLAAAAHAIAQRKLGVEPALALEQGRPTKRDRRQLADWHRWSASVDPD